MMSKIGVLMTLLLIGELVDAPSSSAFENGMLPLADTPPIPGLLGVVFPVALVPGCRMMKDCQSGVPVCGRTCSDSEGRVAEISGVVVSSNGAASLTTTCCVVCPTPN